MSINLQLPKIDEKCSTLSINGKHGLCRAYYQPDSLDIKTLEYATSLLKFDEKNLTAIDLGCSPYFPQSQRLAKLGFYVDAFDLEKPIESFKQINQQYDNRINYQIKNIADIKGSDLRNNYQIVYSNRCLSFLSYQQTHYLLHLFSNHLKQKTRFFLGFFTESAQYAENYPIHLPLENRYVPLDNPIAKENEMLAPVCVYKYDEIIKDLFGGLPISIIEEIQTQSGSIKIIFEM